VQRSQEQRCGSRPNEGLRHYQLSGRLESNLDEVQHSASDQGELTVPQSAPDGPSDERSSAGLQTRMGRTVLLLAFALAGVLDALLPAAALNALLVPRTATAITVIWGGLIVLTASAVAGSLMAVGAVKVLWSGSRGRLVPTLAVAEGVAVILLAVGTARIELGFELEPVWVDYGAIALVALGCAVAAARFRKAGPTLDAKQRRLTWTVLVALTLVAVPLLYIDYSSVTAGR
jgi:hypothetical protein